MRRRVKISQDEARRIALAAQGFDRQRPANPDDVRHYRRVLANITVLQLDFVNVLMPAHFLMIWSRLGAYDRMRFESWLYHSGEHTEQWAHEASIVAIKDWPLLKHRRREFQQHKNSPLNKLPDRSEYLRTILRQVELTGAVTSADIPAVSREHKRKPGDWHRSIPRRALEDHFGSGKLAVQSRKSNFQRIYDLPERLIPDDIANSALPREDAERRLVVKSARALGVATCRDIADYYRMTPSSARPRIEELIEEGVLHEVCVDGWQNPGYLADGAAVPRSIKGASLLSPFDPVVWFRPRVKRLFDFEYRIEIYVTAAKRRWGYYVLPFREGDRITARVDLKADRKGAALVVQNAHCESCADSDNTPRALARELRALANWLNLDRIVVRNNGEFDKSLKRACRKDQ